MKKQTLLIVLMTIFIGAIALGQSPKRNTKKVSTTSYNDNSRYHQNENAFKKGFHKRPLTFKKKGKKMKNKEKKSSHRPSVSEVRQMRTKGNRSHTRRKSKRGGRGKG